MVVGFVEVSRAEVGTAVVGAAVTFSLGVGLRASVLRGIRLRWWLGGWGGCGQQFVNTPWGPRWVWVGDCW